MDFHLGEDLLAVRDLAAEVLADKATPERLRAVEQSDSRVDEDLWAVVAETGLLGVAVPEESGGAGLGLPGLVVLLEEQGRSVAPVPVWSGVLAARALARWGSPDQQDLVAEVIGGTRRITLALEDPACAPDGSACRAERTDGGWLLSGVKLLVPSAVGADQVVVRAVTPAGPGLFLLDVAAAGVDLVVSEVTSHDRAADLRLDRAPAQAVGTPGGPAAPTLQAEAVLAIAALQLGVGQGALRLATAHLSQRHQFGRPLGTFQAVQHQLADCWIDLDALRVTLWQAVTDVVDDPLAPAAARAVRVAQWWSAQAGLDVVHRVQHLHGGLGVDVDYPVHRYFLWGKQLAGTFGGPAATLAELGDLLAGAEVGP